MRGGAVVTCAQPPVTVPLFSNKISELSENRLPLFNLDHDSKAQADESMANEQQVGKDVLAATCNSDSLSVKMASWAKAQAESRASDEKVAKDVLASTCSVESTAAKYAAFVGKQAAA